MLLSLQSASLHPNEKALKRRCKHCMLAAVRRTHKQTHKHINRQGRLQYTLCSLARTVISMD